jgi:hypothetical protein
MIGRDPNLKVSTADDGFHPPSSDDVTWIETMWFPFWVPEEGISASVRVWFSPNVRTEAGVGQQGGAVAGWKGASQGLFGDRWAEAFRPDPNLLDLQVGSGLSIECLTPLEHYRIRHSGPHSSLSLEFEAMMPPNPVAPEESPGMFAGHFEQSGHVTGELVIRERKISIDCYSIRDRSWGPRQMPEELRLGNSHGACEDFAFFTYVNPTPDGVEKITSGYLLCDGVEAAIVEGIRETELRDGLPVSVKIEAVDATGRALRARGTCRNVMASNAGNGVYAVLNLIEWLHEDGRVSWGENHDVWSETAWLAAGRPKL